MATGWSVLDALNKNSKATVDETAAARFRTRDISIRKMYSNDGNFYSMEGVEELAQDILAVGLLQNMVVTYEPCERGEYKIIAGERRWRALKLLIEKGYEEFEITTCQIKTPKETHEETVQLILANAYRNKTVMDVLEEEKQLKASLQYMKDNNIPLAGYSLESGRLRDVIADIMKTTGTKIAQIESINKRLIPEFTQELREGRLTFSAAYEISGMDEERQKEMLEQYQEKGSLTWKDVKEAKKATEEALEAQQIESQMTYPEDFEESDPAAGDEKQPGDDWEDAHPKGITSLCYSCTEYEKCNVKTGTCTECDKFKNGYEAYMTDEQRYNKEQDAIDRETKKKLQEQEREKRLDEHMEGDSRKKMVRMAKETFARIEKGIQTFVILKDESFKAGQQFEILEFSEGRATGRTMNLEVAYMEDAHTSSALEDGYCVLGIRKTEDETNEEG